ncbi:MAG: hypothetical protein ABSH16_10950, partial [Sedimentisphaerales bacterium]
GVTSKITRHSSSQVFLKGEVNDVVISSRGNIQLGRQAEVLVKQFEDVWSINSIVVIGDAVYIGTSPNGGVYEYSAGKLKKIYSAKAAVKAKPAEVNEPNDANSVQQEKHLANEHIFAMGKDISGRLLVGISGQRCALCRFEQGQMKTVFEPNDANYIFAIAVTQQGDIYLGTGPKGKIYRLDSLGKKGEVVAETTDKNILSLAIGDDGQIYAGSDSRGLVYSVNPKTKEVKVLYDSEQQEITSLLFFGENLYASATSAQIVQQEARFAVQPAQPGKPEEKEEEGDEPGGDDDASAATDTDDSTPSAPIKSGLGTDTVGEDTHKAGLPVGRSTTLTTGGTKLQIANTKEKAGEKPAQPKMPPARPAKPAQASVVYRITKDGFVTDIFSETAVFFCMDGRDKELLLGTGNDARLYSIEPNSEQQTIVYQDHKASQITAVADSVYIGTANPARVMRLGNTFAREGTYESELVDAGQPAKWGKLQIEADIPADCNILMACRSGNVKDVNDPSFSKWTEPEVVTGPVDLNCPTGRFCQYKLIFRSRTGQSSPVVREVAVASMVPNLAPRVESVTAARVNAPGKNGVFRISYDVKDDNGDKLIYKIYFRKAGRTGWIELKNDIETNSYEWDSRTVEDGRYEIRVTASDERSNTPETKLTGSRVSDTFTVDNTAPVVKRHKIDRSAKSIRLKMTVSDELSVIGKVEYTIDSDANWLGVVPDDLVYDTTTEDFTIIVENLTPGQHVIALRLADDVGNTTYKSYDFVIEKK